MFVEKPLGMGASDSAAIARAIQQAGVISDGIFSAQGIRKISSQSSRLMRKFGKITPHSRQQLSQRRAGPVV